MACVANDATCSLNLACISVNFVGSAISDPFNQSLASKYILKHVVVGFDYFGRDIQCIPPVGVSKKVSIVKNVHFSFTTLDLNSERSIKIIHDVLGFMVDTRKFVLNGNALGFHCRLPLNDVETSFKVRLTSAFSFEKIVLSSLMLTVALSLERQWQMLIHLFHHYKQAKKTVD